MVTFQEVDGVSCFVFSDVLVLDHTSGILGTTADYSIEDNDQREVEVRIVLPERFFSPLKVNVQVDPKLMAAETKGSAESVTFPVEVDKGNKEVLITAEAASEASSFLGFLKKKLAKVL